MPCMCWDSAILWLFTHPVLSRDVLLNFNIYLISWMFVINFSIVVKCSVFCCILLSSTLQLTYINLYYRKDRKMALVTLTSTEEAIDALIVSFILPILKMFISTQGFLEYFQQKDNWFSQANKNLLNWTSLSQKLFQISPSPFPRQSPICTFTCASCLAHLLSIGYFD